MRKTKENNTEKLQKLLVPYLSDEIDSYTVSKNVNIPDTDSPELIKPMDSA